MKKSLEYYKNLKITDNMIESIANDLIDGRKRLEVHGHCISVREKVKRLVVKMRASKDRKYVKNARHWIKVFYKNRNN